MSEIVINNETKPMKRSAFDKRIHEIDFVRGILIILVIIDHIFCFTNNYTSDWMNLPGYEWMGNIHNVTNFYWTSLARTIIRQLALFGFCFTSGVSCAFSKNNWKRAGQLLVVAFLLAIITNIANVVMDFEGGASMAITFNVIAVLGCSVLMYCFVQDKSNRALWILLLITILISIWFIPLIDSNSKIRDGAILLPFFSPEEYGFYQGDYMPLFPYCIAFFLGAIFARYFYKEKKSLLPRYEFERPICFVGRHTLIIYATHALIIIGVLAIINIIIRSSL